MTNPKAAMMWIAITAFLFGSGLQTSQVFWIAPLGSLSALIIYGCYGFIFSTLAARILYRRFTQWIELMFGVLFGGLGFKLIYDGSVALIHSLSNSSKAI